MIKRLLLLLVLAAAGSSRGFVVEFNGAGFPLRWNFAYTFNPSLPVGTNIFDTANHAVRYSLAADAWSATNTANELNAVRASIAQWEAIPGTSIKMEEGPLIQPGTNALDINLGVTNSDGSPNISLGTNYFFWKKGTSTLVDDGHADLGPLLGLTFRSWYPSSNMLTIAQTVFNGVDYSWFTDFSDSNNPNYFVEGTATHEFGHFLGLDHSPAGAATMVWQGVAGLDFQTELSADEIAAARFLYPAADTTQGYGTISGTASFNTTNLLTIAQELGITLTNSSEITNYFTSTNVLGVVVVAEDLHGNVACGSVTATNGFYILPSLLPGTYNVRVSPLDSTENLQPLILGANISSPFAGAFTSFLPSSNYVVTVEAGATNVFNPLISVGFRPWVLNYFLDPWNPLTGGFYDLHAQGLQIGQGTTNFIIGVGAFSIPTANLGLAVSGDGVEYGPTTVDTNTYSADAITLLTIPITVNADAVPGLRTLFVTSTNITIVTNAQSGTNFVILTNSLTGVILTNTSNSTAVTNFATVTNSASSTNYATANTYGTITTAAVTTNLTTVTSVTYLTTLTTVTNFTTVTNYLMGTNYVTNFSTFTYAANGYLRINPSIPDFNFDGLDDRFQRQYFALYTSPEAAPLSDPDGDGYNNFAEYISGTVPTNAASFLSIDFATQTTNGVLLGWQGQPGKTYQVQAKDQAAEAGWESVASPFLSSAAASAEAAAAAHSSRTNSSGFEVLYFDPSATNRVKFYRVQALPGALPLQ